MRTTLQYLAILVVASSSSTLWASPYISTGQYFAEPGSWTVGAAGSTHQAWDDFFLTSGNLPDAGYNTNPAIATDPVANATGAMVTGTKNFYQFSGNYSADADIYNHGTVGTDGTHIIVQTSATANGGTTVIPGSLEVVDLGGSALTGGDNASALVNGDLLAAGVVSSSFGDVDMRVSIWEFFLPNYTGDFHVQWDESVHSSFDQLRVDSLITASALPATSFTFQAIPEPGSVVLALLGLIGVAGTRRSRS